MSQVQRGYQQTDFGTFPDDWQSVTLASTASRTQNAIVGGPFGSDLVSADYTINGVPVIRGQNMGRKYVGGEFAFVSATKAKSLTANCASAADLIFTQRGTLGQVSIVPDGAFERYVVSQSQMKLSVNNQRFDPEYLYYYFSSPVGQSQVIDSAIQTGVPHTNLGILRQYRLPVPTRLSEQKAISQALRNIDDLIASLDALITKKRDIKRGAMQQLLTGKRRLPGYSGEWKEWRYKNFVRHHAGNSFLIKGRLDNTGLHGRFKAFSASGQDVWVDEFEHTGDAIIVSAVGSRCGKCFAARGHWSAIANTHVLWIDEAIANKDFIFRFFDDESFWIKGGSGQPFVKFRDSFDRDVLLPSICEQQEIVMTLQVLDDELTALITMRDKNMLIRQGMMQQLLTGRIRLI